MTEEEEKKKGFPVWAIIVILIFILLVAGFVYFGRPKYLKHRNKKEVMGWLTSDKKPYQNLTQQQKYRKLRKKIQKDYNNGAFKSHEQFLRAYHQPENYFHDTTLISFKN